MLTEEKLQKAVEDCKWRKDFDGIWICSGNVLPCMKCIDDGRCDTLIELFTKERENGNIY